MGCAYFFLINFPFQSSNEIDSIMLYESIFCGIWAIVLVFISCEFGQRYSNAYDAIGDEFNKIDWYLIPFSFRMYPNILIPTMYSQKNLEIQFFGSTSCSREQFKRVRKIACVTINTVPTVSIIISFTGNLWRISRFYGTPSALLIDWIICCECISTKITILQLFSLRVERNQC